MADAQKFAAIDTKKWFIDYSDLSETEQKWLKNIIPFYTWIRKNLANQLSGLMLMPEAYRVAAKAEEAISLDEFDFSEIPEYMKEMGYLPISRGETGPIMWWPNFPYADLNKIPLYFEEGGLFEGGAVPYLKKGAIMEEFASSAHPIVKTIIQRMTDKNLFKQRDFLDQVDAPLGQIFASSPRIVGFLDNAMKKIGFDGGAASRS